MKTRKDVLSDKLKLRWLFGFLPLTFIILFTHLNSFAQETESLFFIVADSANGAPIPYASVKILHRNEGTLSNLKGECRLVNYRTTDSILVSTFGYKKMQMSIKELALIDTLWLSEEAQVLQEVIILSDNSVLYDLLSECRPSKSEKTSTKSFYELETYIDKRKAEKIQAYYTGSMEGYDCKDLQLKNMRFGVQPVNNRLFTSIEVSKSFYSHSVFNPSDYFPENPFYLKKRKLIKYYSLVLYNKYTDRENRVIYRVGFNPKEDSTHYFSGEVWIDSTTHTLLKIDLSIKNASQYPFTAFWSIHSLSNVDLFISKTFKTNNGNPVLSSVNFNYELTYIGDNNVSITVKTNAVLENYSMDDQFFNPQFDFQPGINKNSELLKLSLIEENDQFWNCMKEFRSSSDFKRDSTFYHSDSVISGKTLMTEKILNGYRFFEKPYVLWGEDKRVIFKTNDSLQASIHRQGMIPTNSYDLNAQIYVDIIQTCDSTKLVMNTVFDPFSSYYNLIVSNETNAFINIYFDLMEIQRRKYEQKIRAILGASGSESAIKELLDSMKIENEELKRDYFKKVQRGTIKNELVKWNQLVKDELNIDNLSVFHVAE